MLKKILSKKIFQAIDMRTNFGYAFIPCSNVAKIDLKIL